MLASPKTSPRENIEKGYKFFRNKPETNKQKPLWNSWVDSVQSWTGDKDEDKGKGVSKMIGWKESFNFTLFLSFSVSYRSFLQQFMF